MRIDCIIFIPLKWPEVLHPVLSVCDDFVIDRCQPWSFQFAFSGWRSGVSSEHEALSYMGMLKSDPPPPGFCQGVSHIQGCCPESPCYAFIGRDPRESFCRTPEHKGRLVLVYALSMMGHENIILWGKSSVHLFFNDSWSPDSLLLRKTQRSSFCDSSCLEGSPCTGKKLMNLIISSNDWFLLYWILPSAC